MSGNNFHCKPTLFRLGSILITLSLLTACDSTGAFNLNQVLAPNTTEESSTGPVVIDGSTVEQDVEAPEVFSANEPGLWDGRPSLGGVWVAHPDVTDPERVIVRNQSNGRSVVGALFRRERDIPGPRLQMSSDAAEALGVLAGAPVELSVTAFRKRVVAQSRPDQRAAQTSVITESSLDSISANSAGIAPTEQAPIANLPQTKLTKPFIQIGIFSQEANAKRVEKQMRSAGIVPTVTAQESSGKSFWRVIAGPANTASEREKLLDTIKGEGFSDAYAVTN